MSWIDELSERKAARIPCALVVVIGGQGSVPRDAGARMIVCDGKLAWGTIGGGKLEQLAIEHATALLERGEACTEAKAYPLAAAAGQCCGGNVTLFFETFPWTRRRLVVFGAGHVGRAVAALAPWMSADVLVVDGRQEAEIQPALPKQRAFELRCIDAPEGEVETIAGDSLVLVMTHSHALDLEIIAACLKRGSFPYVGLIGSERKWVSFRRQLAARGFAERELLRVRCPIGVSKGSKEPGAIALSAACELTEVWTRLEGVQSTRSSPSFAASEES